MGERGRSVNSASTDWWRKKIRQSQLSPLDGLRARNHIPPVTGLWIEW
jgi:hypothetical protein